MPYDDISDHLLMLRDEIRTEAYQKAIQSTVKAGDQVMDFGCGTGVLSLFSEKAGAEKVYAIDRSVFIHAAQEIARSNGSRNIEFIKTKGEKLDLDAKVDVLVSEWMGHFLFWEWMLEPLIKLRDKHLKPQGHMIPARATLDCALVTDAALYEKLAFFNEPRYGLDYAFVKDWPLHQPQLVHFEGTQVTREHAQLEALDLAKIDKTPEEMQASLTLAEDTEVFGICGWFTTELTDEIIIDTSPDAPKTHWTQVFFPLKTPMQIKADSPVEIRINVQKLDESNQIIWNWQLAQDDQSQQMSSFAHQAWLQMMETQANLKAQST